MKKLLILAGVMLISTVSVTYAETTVQTVQKAKTNSSDVFRHPKISEAELKKKQAEFENRLKLTDEQKVKAEELRQKGREEMQPIVSKIKEKRQEIETVKLTKISAEAQEEKIQQLQKEIGALRKEAHRLRMQNMKDFEALLTKKQLKELEKMKKEGREKFDKEHHNAPKLEPRIQK